MEHPAAEQLLDQLVYVCAVQRHPDALDHGVVGVVRAVDTVGLRLELVRGPGLVDGDRGQVRFVPWSAVEYVVLDPR